MMFLALPTKASAVLVAALATGAAVAAALRGEPVARFRDAVTSHVVPMRRYPVPHAQDAHLVRRRANVSTSLTNVHDVYYIIDLQVGNQIIPVSVDTGSSDTWMVQEPYTCVSMWFDAPGTKPNCGLGSGFKGNLSGGLVPNVQFGRAYADGTFVQGYFGFDDVTIGGLTARHQRLAIVNYTYWFGDGRTSGLLGLAYPYMTSLDGSSPDQPLYDPVFTTLWKDNLIAPLFSMALSRYADQSPTKSPPTTDAGHETSYLALGGLPPVAYDDASWARTPIQNMSALTRWGLDTQEHGLYVITAEAYAYGRGSTDGLIRNTSQFPVLIDAGSTLTILPKTLVENLYKSFDPPAEYMYGTGLYYARCNATVPAFGVQLGGTTFYMAPEDLLRQSVRDETGEWCRIGVTDSDATIHVLGVTFLTNVVAVFDVGNQEMRFAKRTKY